jgi:hypothetical protein
MDHVATFLSSDAFKLYQARIDQLKQDYLGMLPSSLRRFDVRFRLALGTTVQFNHEIAYTRTASTRRAYSLLHRLNDLWFSWEGLIRLCKEHGAAIPNAPLLDPFSPGSPHLEKLAITNDVISVQFNAEITKSNRRRTDANGFIDYLRKGGVIHGKLGRRLALLQDKINTEHSTASKIDWQDTLALAYAIRNSHVHGCDGAHSGVGLISTKLALLDVCVFSLLHTNLTVALAVTDPGKRLR